MLVGLVNGTVGIVGEVFIIDGEHISFRDEVEGLWDSENFDCVAMRLAEAQYTTRKHCRAGKQYGERKKTSERTGQLTEPFKDLLCGGWSCVLCGVHLEVVCAPVDFVYGCCSRAVPSQVDACEVFAELDGLLAEGVCGLGSNALVDLVVHEDDDGVFRRSNLGNVASAQVS